MQLFDNIIRLSGTVQDDYVTNTLKLEPVRFPDYNTVYANVKNGQVDAWVAPSQQATGQVKEGDKTVTYYLADNDVSKKFHENICKETKKVKATGTVKEVDGKMELTPTKIELVKE